MMNKNLLQKIGLSRQSLILILIVLMTLDHIAWFWLRGMTGELFHLFGRVVMPLFCYFLVIGYHYTSNKLHYGGRLLFFANISQIPYAIFNKTLHYPDQLNPIFTLFLGFLLLCATEQTTKLIKFVKTLNLYHQSFLFVALGLSWTTIFLMLNSIGDWFSYGAGLWLVIMGLYLSTLISSSKAVWAGVLVCLFAIGHYVSYQSYDVSAYNLMLYGWLLVIPLVLLYRPQWGVGSRHWLWRYALYLYYPLHFVVLLCIYHLI